MTHDRTAQFHAIADSEQALAVLCHRQADTEAWWIEWGTAFRAFNELVLAAPPRDEHVAATNAAMHGPDA